MRQIVSIWILLMALGAFPAAALPGLCAAPVVAGDADLDGFSNAQECAPLALATGLQLAANASTSVAPCSGGESGAPRALCLHPSARDLFWIDETGSLPLPAGVLVGLGSDLGITFHRLVRTAASTARIVSPASAQKAVQIVTDPSSASGVLGRANWGTPNNLDGTTIYPNRIAAYVNGLCPLGTVCRSSTGLEQGAPAIIALLTRWVTDHEVGHTIKLTRVFDSRYGGYHEVAGSLKVMEQTPKVVAIPGSVTFYVASVFSSASATDAKLK